MRNDPRLLDLLCCVRCRGALSVCRAETVEADGQIMTGELACAGCTARYPITHGVPRFIPVAQQVAVSMTVDGFGFQWRRADGVIQDTRFTAAETFLDFIWPVQPQDFRAKIVLDAGCGSGRFTRWAHEFGASVAIGVDLSQSVEVAFRNTRALPDVLIIQADLFQLPLRPAFDYVFSVGVLHHAADPRKAFDAIVALLRPGGAVSAWVYARENNGWIIHVLNPLRRHLTSRLPRRALLVLAYLLAIPLYAFSKGVYGPVGNHDRLAPLRRILFYFDYLHFLSRFGFHTQAYIIFDHLMPTLAAYIPREEFSAWFAENGLQGVTITSRTGNSWRGFGVRVGA